MKINKLLLRPAGMFSNVNEVVQQLYLAEQNNYRFIIDWSHSCYLDPCQEGDPWRYYFEDCYPGIENITAHGKPEVIPYGPPVACSKNNIITPRLIDGRCSPLLLPKDRGVPHHFIKNHIVVKPHIRNIVDSFIREKFTDYTIGLHIRGPGRIDGGAPGIRSRYPNKNGVPFGQYFKFVDRQLLEHPGARIFICSDSDFVIKEIVANYNSKVILYNATRSEFGEMHVPGHPANRGAVFPPYKLGEDVLVEAFLLCATDYFVHGNSNVVNFTLCENPLLPHKYVYEET